MRVIFCGKFVLLAGLAIFLQACATKPQPLSFDELQRRAENSKIAVAEYQQPVSRPIDLYQAMARAVKYNLNYRVKIAESRLSSSQAGLLHHSLLPKAVANANYTARNNFLASSSYNIETKTTNFGASTSQEKQQDTGDLSFSWNILDFGLSYIRAQQAGDKALIASELQNKVLLSLLDEVRRAYWMAISAQHLAKKLSVLKRRILKAQKNTRRISSSGETSSSEALINERELIKLTETITKMQREHIAATSELLKLMGLTPNTPVRLTTLPNDRLKNNLKLSPEEMIDIALRDRSELHQIWYQQRINQREAKAAMLELLPGLNVFTGNDWSSNSFLLNSNWVSWGAKASWNLMKVFKYPARKRVIKDEDKLLDTKAKALTIAIMTQVHISRINYQQSLREMEVAHNYRRVQNKLIKQLRIEASADLIGENDLLREELNTLIAQAKFDIANANAQSAFGNLFTTIGWNPVREIAMEDGVPQIAKNLRLIWQDPEHSVQEYNRRLAMN